MSAAGGAELPRTIACSAQREGTWGYARSDDARALADAYRTLLETGRGSTPKFLLAEIALATCGPRRRR
jgi:hypothetical protein